MIEKSTPEQMLELSRRAAELRRDAEAIERRITSVRADALTKALARIAELERENERLRAMARCVHNEIPESCDHCRRQGLAPA